MAYDNFNEVGMGNYSLEPEKNFMYYLKKLMFEWIIPICVEVLVVFLLMKYVFFFIRVPTGSMKPTIQENSIIVTLRTNNPTKSIQRGDVVVFYSKEQKLDMCKRVVGMPGDKVVIQNDGTLLVNGWQLSEPYVKNQFDYDVYYVRNTEFEVPEDHYLFMGDNRYNSDDSRFWTQPYIHKDDIKGEAKFTLFPFENFGLLR